MERERLHLVVVLNTVLNLMSVWRSDNLFKYIAKKTQVCPICSTLNKNTIVPEQNYHARYEDPL